MYQISKELLQANINYLSSRPFNEVHVLISELLKLKEIKEEVNKTNG